MEENPRAEDFDPQEEGLEEHPDPEQYTGSIATALADQRISRKKASEDVKILANRIALLKAEEEKVCTPVVFFVVLFKLIFLLQLGLEKNRRD